LLTISSASPVLHQPGHDLSPALAWEGLLSHFGEVFSAPSFKIFAALLTAWALCPGRRTLTRLWSVIPAGRRRCYSSYARWVREGRWSMDALWGRLVRLLVQHWAPADGRLTLLLDGTLVNKTGRKVDVALTLSRGSWQTSRTASLRRSAPRRPEGSRTRPASLRGVYAISRERSRTPGRSPWRRRTSASARRPPAAKPGPERGPASPSRDPGTRPRPPALRGSARRGWRPGTL